MNSNKVTPELLNSLGQAVMDFGFMESALRTVLLALSRDVELSKVLVPAGNSVSQNLELLMRMCRFRVHPQALGNWLEAIEDIRELFVERNRIFHGMFYQYDAKLFLAKTKKGKNGSQDVWLENEFDPNSVNAILVRLGNRRRQLMDFVDDFSRDVNGPQHAASQDAHASLTING